MSIRLACASSTSPLAVRRLCPREVQRTSVRRCSSTPTGTARTLGRRYAAHAAGLASRPSPQDFPPCPLPFDKPACSAPLVSARGSAERPRLKTKLTARRCSSTLAGVARAFGRRRAVHAAGLPPVPARFSAVPAALREARLQCAARVRGRVSRTPRLKTKLAARQCSTPLTGVARALGRRYAVRAAGLPASAGFPAVPAAIRQAR